jgi:hypothetical protein
MEERRKNDGRTTEERRKNDGRTTQEIKLQGEKRKLRGYTRLP